jgi:hypothetical protein
VAGATIEPGETGAEAPSGAGSSGAEA